MTTRPADERARILLVDDEHLLVRALTRIMLGEGHHVDTAEDVPTAEKMIEREEYDVIFTDIHMPGPNGVALLAKIRQRGDTPVVILTGNPQIETAMEAVEHGALRYLTKPVDPKLLSAVIQDALARRHLSKMHKRAIALLGEDGAPMLGTDDVHASFDRAVEQIFMAYQPIVRLASKSVHAYEALARTKETAFPNPLALFAAAERLGKLDQIGRTVRSRITHDISRAPVPRIFMNVLVRDLLDDRLFDGAEALSMVAPMIVLEVTERADIHSVRDVRDRMARLRSLGFTIAVDDLGAGYAGLNSVALIEPEIVKIDMTLVRSIDKEPTKQKLVRVIMSLAAEMKSEVVAEGIETIEERNVLADLGCSLFQGYLFGKPQPDFPMPSHASMA